MKHPNPKPVRFDDLHPNHVSVMLSHVIIVVLFMIIMPLYGAAGLHLAALRNERVLWCLLTVRVDTILRYQTLEFRWYHHGWGVSPATAL